MEIKYDPFRYRHKFQDDVWGQIKLNDLERDVIDTPEFQRLFRTSQLGFVDLVYHTANHTRGAHSIGACHIANRLINHLVENTSELFQAHESDPPGIYAKFAISPSERVLIRLGALLHDISHVPLSHDLEKKSHKVFYAKDKELRLRSWYGHYDKHDDYKSNPLLFVLLFDHEISVLARVLRNYSKEFYIYLNKDINISSEPHNPILDFLKLVRKKIDSDFDRAKEGWDPEKDLLPQLIFHLLVYEKPKDADNSVIEIVKRFGGEKEKWHLGPKSLTETEVKNWHDSWYQPFRHDIIGNTLSADLIDYLTRDPQRLGTHRQVDLHLLSYYALVNTQREKGSKGRFRCAIDLQDHKRGTTRTFLLNDLFRLLDLRQDIHEKAVMHRVVQSANAMLARGLLLLGKDELIGGDTVVREDNRPPPMEVVGLGKKQQHALQGEDLFFQQLLKSCEIRQGASAAMSRRLHAARRIFEKLIERRVYRPLVIIPGNWAGEKLSLPEARGWGDRADDFPLRTLAAIVDSAYYSPFLLFACSCVEKYLQGVFDTDLDLCHYIQRISEEDPNAEIVQEASRLVPSRIITWTTPYKQLYKDPAVVVAVDGFVGQIDEVIESAVPRDESTRRRIKTAIQDADSKYATLWQLYVFVSDGLFYSGILNKLLKNIPTLGTADQGRDIHRKRLKNAQAFLSLAFKAICGNWSGLDQQKEGVEAKEKLLHNRMDADAFQELLISWVALYRCKTAWPKKWSTVEVEHYYHEYALDKSLDDDLKRPCRDIRYKFDRDSQEMWQKAMSDQKADGHEFVQFLKKCHIDASKLLSEGEFKHLAALYKDEEIRGMCDRLLNKPANVPPQIPDALKALWMAGFPSLKPEKEVSIETEFPETNHEIEEWLLREAEILYPNVRRQLTENLKPLCDVLMQASFINGREVFNDFKFRLQRESTLLWNDLRASRIVNIVNKKWKLSDAREITEDDEED